MSALQPITDGQAQGRSIRRDSRATAAIGTAVFWLTLMLLLLAVGWMGRSMKVDLLLPAGIFLMALLAYANGANDVSKAIATLVGSGISNYRRAILYGAVCTTVGAAISGLVAASLVTTFTTGLVSSFAPLTERFALASLVGAISWVFLATRLGLPVSTTHAITGAVVLAGSVAYGVGTVQWTSLGQRIIVPLLLSPIVALALGMLLYAAIRLLRGKLNPDSGHWLSSGAASLTRGLNDAPKIVALGSIFFLLGQQPVAGANVSQAATPVWLFLLVAATMGIGSVAGGLKVTETLAVRVTKMDHYEGLAANVATALLVGLASPLGVPVSTTHVSSGSIIGVGLTGGARKVQWRTVRDMALAWLVTVPVASLMAALTYMVLGIALA